jgi:hypothetical protein
LPLLPLHGLPLPFEQGSPGGIVPWLWLEVPLPWPEAFGVAVRTMAPLSTRAALTAGAKLPAATINAACANDVGADAS